MGGRQWGEVGRRNRLRRRGRGAWFVGGFDYVIGQTSLDERPRPGGPVLESVHENDA